MMGQIKPAPQGHLFLAIMSESDNRRKVALDEVQTRFGEILGAGPLFSVSDFTNYYESEFGRNLKKQFFIFKQPINLENAHQIKVWTNRIESQFVDNSGGRSHRQVNLDPGYLEPSKLVLFSTKNFSHRIYCGDGVFAEVTLIYEHGQFKILPWTYPDYYWEKNLEFLMQIRNEIVRLSRESSRQD